MYAQYTYGSTVVLLHSTNFHLVLKYDAFIICYNFYLFIIQLQNPHVASEQYGQERVDLLRGPCLYPYFVKTAIIGCIVTGGAFLTNDMELALFERNLISVNVSKRTGFPSHEQLFTHKRCLNLNISIISLSTEPLWFL